jgi:tRNA nucleotidyltransferase (CCA-adding enzyme)
MGAQRLKQKSLVMWENDVSCRIGAERNSHKMILELPNQITEVLDKLAEHEYSSYIYGECVRLLIKGQTLFEYSITTDAKMSRIRAIFDGYNVIEDKKDDSELVVRVLGVALSITSHTNLDEFLKGISAFSFDAIAYNHNKGFHDPFGGVNALKDGEIRHLIMTAEETLFKREELETILMGRYIKEVLEEYADVFAAIIPELYMLSEFDEEQGTDLLLHTFKAVGSSSPDLSLRYALLFHELGKPDCHSKDADGNSHFYGHAERSRIYSTRIMERIDCNKSDIKDTGYIIENYEKVFEMKDGDYQDLRDGFELLRLLLLFNCADCRAHPDEKFAEKNAMQFRKLSKLVY